MTEQNESQPLIADNIKSNERTDHLADNMDYHKDIINSISDAIITTDLEYRILSWNRAAENLFGWSESEAIGKNAVELLKTEYRHDKYAESLAVLMADKTLDIDILQKTKAGKALTILGKISLLHDKAGNTIGMVGVMHDITKRKEMEDALRKQTEQLINKENELGKILDGLSMATWIIDFKKEEFEYTTGWEKYVSAENMVGQVQLQKVMSAFSTSDMEDIVCKFNECLSMHKDRFEIEHRMLVKNNKYIWVNSNIKITFDDNGCPAKLFGVSFDVTNRKSLEIEQKEQHEELKRTRKILSEELSAMNYIQNISTRFVREDNLNAVLEDIVDAAIHITRADMCILHLFDTQADCLRIAAHRGLSQPFLEYFCTVREGDFACGTAFKKRKRIIIDDVTKSSIYTKEDMGRLLSAGILAMQSTPLLGKNKLPVGVLSTHYNHPHHPREWELRLLDMLDRLAADIIERATAETKLQWSGQSTEILYETVDRLLSGDRSRDVIPELCRKVMEFLGCSIFFNYIFTNDKQQLKLNASEGITEDQRKPIEWLAPGQLPCGRVAKSGCRLILENVQDCADDNAMALKPLGIRAYACHPLVVKEDVLGTLAFATTARDAFTADELSLMKAVSGHVAVALNRLRTEENLESITKELYGKNELITDFFTNISHEFKTPLSIILVDLQLMEYRMKDADGEFKEKLGKMIAVMRQNALRLLRLIGNLLDVTKIDAGFMKVRLINLDVVEMVRGLVESVSDIARSAGISMAFVCACKHKLMPIDSEKMERIMLNLLSNAIKHTPPGGHITVGLKVTANGILLAVRDDGDGIPLDKQEFIFDRFRQANSSLTRSSEGCGIGLSLVKALVELLKGRIWFVSSLDAGSEFFVELPVLLEIERTRASVIEGMPRSRKVEMEFSDINKIGS